MANPAEHSARAEAERRGDIVGSDVDVVESRIIADLAGDEDEWGAWLVRGESPLLWGFEEPL